MDRSQSEAPYPVPRPDGERASRSLSEPPRETINGTEPLSGQPTTPTCEPTDEDTGPSQSDNPFRDSFPEAVPVPALPLPIVNPQSAQSNENTVEATTPKASAAANPLGTASAGASHANLNGQANGVGVTNGVVDGAANGDIYGLADGTPGTRENGESIFARRRRGTGSSNPMVEHIEHVAAPAAVAAAPIPQGVHYRPANGRIVPLQQPVPAPPRSLEHYRRRLSEDSEAKAKELQKRHKEGRDS